jgi:CDP-diacylglycerol--serine O-phosphatidyltransferase
MKRFRIPRRQKLFAVLPTMLTLGNAVCGFGAITFAAKVGLAERMGWGRDNTECLWIAAVLIFLAMVFDMLDGRAARWAKQTSQFGAELDSLCDAISFGVAPAVILVKFSTDAHPAMPVPAARLLWAIAVLFVVCAILRLARFNVETDDEDTHQFFTGLPSPAAAGTVASFMIANPEIQDLARPLVGSASTLERVTHVMATYLLTGIYYLVPLVALACACLMVSRIRYSHVFNQLFRRRRKFQEILSLLAGLALVFIVGWLAVPLILCIFAFGSPVRAGWSAIGRWRLGAASTAAAPSAGPLPSDSNGHPSTEGRPTVLDPLDRPD